VFRKTQVDPAEIIHELYIDVKENNREIKNTENDYLCYSKRWIKSRLTWTGGNVINKIKITDQREDDIQKFSYKLSVEPERIKTDLRADLESVGFTEEQSEKLELVILKSKTLPLYHRRLFDLYYREGLSIQKIADSCNLPKTTIQREIEKLKTQLKTDIT
jgi:DNA-directed RNA polymerase specialized sigma24 family protein